MPVIQSPETQSLLQLFGKYESSELCGAAKRYGIPEPTWPVSLQHGTDHFLPYLTALIALRLGAPTAPKSSSLQDATTDLPKGRTVGSLIQGSSSSGHFRDFGDYSFIPETAKQQVLPSLIPAESAIVEPSCMGNSLMLNQHSDGGITSATMMSLPPGSS